MFEPRYDTEKNGLAGGSVRTFFVLLVLTVASFEADAYVKAPPALRVSLEILLSGVEHNDLAVVHSVSTRQGYQLIVRGLKGHKEAGRILASMGTENAASKVRWTDVSRSVAHGNVKFVTLEFLFENGKWKFNNATVK